LVLDEPVSALDVSIQAQIINLLQTLQRERDLAFLFIAHDLAVVRHVSHRIAVMYLGRIVELAARDQLYAAPAHPYTRSLLAAVPVPDPAVERARARVTAIGEIGSAASLPTGCRFHPRCPRAREIAAGAAGAARAQASAVACVDTAWGRLPAACVHDEPGLAPQQPGEREAATGALVACHFPHSPAPRRA
jgi:oligopeptide transport system ATP-binding protein